MTFIHANFHEDLQTIIKNLSNTSLLRECIQNFLDWPREARTANGTALCH
jgi:hypothetical protein